MHISVAERMNRPRSLERGEPMSLEEQDVYSCTLSRPTQVVKLLTPTTEMSIKVMGRLSQVRMQDLGPAVPPGTPESCPNGDAITASEEGRRLVRLRMERLLADCGPCRPSQEG